MERAHHILDRVILRGGVVLSVFAALFFLAQPLSIEAAVQQTYDVQPGATTIQQIQSTVRGINGNMTGDIVVNLHGGTYAITSPITFSSADSGTNGFNIIYQAAAGERPVISGGVPVTGWTLHDASKNIWQANSPVSDTRQLYVNGTRATRAHLGNPNQSSLSQFPTPASTSGGVTTLTTTMNMASWRNPTDIEFVFNTNWTGGGAARRLWLEPRSQVISISGNVITIHSAGAGLLPTDVENAYELLDQPGEWYLDKSQRIIYYIPRSGEVMSSANVVVPSTEVLMTGSSVHNVQFKGITFAYAGWLEPNKAGNFNGDQSDFRYSPYVDYVPSAVSFKGSSSLLFQRDVFEHLGASGLDLDMGSPNNTIIGSVFADISANGIRIGRNNPAPGQYPSNAECTTSFVNGFCSPTTIASDPGNNGDQIIDNYVHDVANEYHSGCAIVLGYTHNTVISHNEISNLPFGGICSGWFQDTPYQHDNTVSYNYIHHIMETLADCGGIYNLSTSPGTKWFNNWIDDNPNNNGAGGSLYTDNNSSYVEIYNNVVSNIAGWWYQSTMPYIGLVLNNAHSPGNHDISVHNNFTNASAWYQMGTVSYSLNGTFGQNIALANNTLISGGQSNWPAAAQAIAASAGIESSYSDIKSITDASLSTGSGGSSGNSGGISLQGSGCTNYASVQVTGITNPCPVFSLGAANVSAGGVLSLNFSLNSVNDYFYNTLYVSDCSSGTCQWNKWNQAGSAPIPGASINTTLPSGKATVNFTVPTGYSVGPHFILSWDWQKATNLNNCYVGPGIDPATTDQTKCGTGSWRIQEFGVQ